MTWVQTYNNVKFDLLNPTPDMVDFSTVARALSRIPRFVAHTEGSQPYSVAQHCVIGSNAIEVATGQWALAFAFLLHDAHEAYIGDIVNPVVAALDTIQPVKAAFTELKKRIDHAIYSAAGVVNFLDAPELQAKVKEFDMRMCKTERDALYLSNAGLWDKSVEQVMSIPGVALEIFPAWGARTAEVEWMARFKTLSYCAAA